MQTDPTVDLKISAFHEKAKQLLLEKKSDSEIVGELIKEGVEPGYAALIIDNVKTELSNRKNFWIELGKGLAVTVFGLILNYFSYTASVGESMWIVFWGIVVFGISIIFRAFILFRK